MAEEKTVGIEIELEDAQLLKLAIDAHEKDITFKSTYVTRYFNNILINVN